MTVNDFAKAVGLKPGTIRTYIKKGLIKAKAIKKGLRTIYEIPESELKNILK